MTKYIYNVQPTISQPIVVQFSSGSIFCEPMMKVFNPFRIHFCPRVNNLPAILKNCCKLSIYNIKPLISQPIVIRYDSGSTFCKPFMKIFNPLPTHFCSEVNRLAAILKNYAFSWWIQHLQHKTYNISTYSCPIYFWFDFL